MWRLAVVVVVGACQNADARETPFLGPSPPPGPASLERSSDLNPRMLRRFRPLRALDNTRWDRFLEGDRTAITSAEKHGLKLFAEIGCVRCHNGELVGGSMGIESDRMKVPSLRNLARTAPLRTAIAMMGKHPLGVDLTAEEVTSIETWLRCLSNDPSQVTPPTLP